MPFVPIFLSNNLHWGVIVMLMDLSLISDSLMVYGTVKREIAYLQSGDLLDVSITFFTFFL